MLLISMWDLMDEIATNSVTTGAEETHCSCVQVVGVDDEQPVRYSAKNALSTETYQVV